MQTGGQTVLFVGDLSYADRYEYNDGVRWDSWGRLVEKSAAYQPWIWTAGNHEIEYRPDLVTYYILRHFQSTKISPVLVLCIIIKIFHQVLGMLEHFVKDIMTN